VVELMTMSHISQFSFPVSSGARVHEHDFNLGPSAISGQNGINTRA